MPFFFFSSSQGTGFSDSSTRPVGAPFQTFDKMMATQKSRPHLLLAGGNLSVKFHK